MTRRNPPIACARRRQSGAVMVIVVLAMAVLLGIAGLALDGSNTMLNKSRLQTAVDAAALSAAKVLDQTRGDVILAETTARGTFSDNANEDGNALLAAASDSGEVSVSFEFSNTLIPFVSGTTPAQYVRVTATDLRLDSWLTPIMGVDEMSVDASAVAGPSTTLGRICNVAPMMVCAGPDPQFDRDAPDYDPYFGFQPNALQVLKAGSPNQAMQKGNFQLIRLDGAAGGSDAREALAGSYDACITSSAPIETEPGNTVGPVSQGLNTRLNRYSGPLASSQDDYPPDVIVTQPDSPLELADDGETILYEGNPVTDGSEISYSYDDYAADVADPTATKLPNGIAGRRVMAMPVGVCGDEAGQSEVPFATVLCFYLVQEVEQGDDPDVFGQFTPDGCRVTGTAGPDPVTGPGPYIIQLYKDPGQVES